MHTKTYKGLFSLKSALLMLTIYPSFAHAIPEGWSGKGEGWSGKANAGLKLSTGNTDSSSIDVGIKARYAKRQWRHFIEANSYFAEWNGADSAERYDASHNLYYLGQGKGYLFNSLNYDSDKFSNINSRISDVVGYGRTIIDNKRHKLDAQLGLGYRKTTFINDERTSNEAIGHFALGYSIKLNDAVTLREQLRTKGGSDNTVSKSVTDLNVKITEKTSLSLKYTVRHNSNVSGDVDKTDTKTSVNLVVSF